MGQSIACFQMDSPGAFIFIRHVGPSKSKTGKSFANMLAFGHFTFQGFQSCSSYGSQCQHNKTEEEWLKT